MTQVAPEKDLISIGKLAAEIQQPVRTIEGAAVALGITPAERRDRVPYFDGHQVQRIHKRLQRSKKQ